MIRRLLILLFLCSFVPLFSQTPITGKIIDKNTQKGLSASIFSSDPYTTEIKGITKVIASGELIVEANEYGEFTLPNKPVNKSKFTVNVQGESFEVVYNNENPWNVEIKLDFEKIGQVNIKQNRLKEKLKESPLTVESMSSQSIKETPASDFYEALGHLKGVDVTAASLGFRIVNTRGFNSTSPVRTLQIIDGVDNQSPGLNFSLGNFLGASELDVNSQEIVVGASSAFYGPGAFNGVISITTKDPWKTPGFSYKFKVGERQLMENSLRYAHVFKTKKGRELIALKANFYYMKAYDWEADNKDPVKDSKYGASNPGGYDAVNRYGDEIPGPGEYNKTNLSGMFDFPGLGQFYREGYWEKDIVNYNTYNLKSSFTVAAKPFRNKSMEFVYQSNFGMGTTVYQGDNRYSLNDIKFWQNRFEFKHRNGFVRVYATQEDAGNTYDAVFTALILQQKAKPADLWGGDYQSAWKTYYANKVKKLTGYPVIYPFQNPKLFADSVNMVIENNKDLIKQWQDECRKIANKWSNFQNRPHNTATYDRYEVGTSRFDSLKNDITRRKSFGEGGSGFFDKSALYHAQAEHRFNLNKRNLIVVGMNGRRYTPNTQGTIFSDTNGRVIVNSEVGAYTGYENKSFNDKLKLNATLRVDKNINFPYIYSPAFSAVYTPDKTTYYRLSLTSGVRNPTLADQYLYYNVGRAILLGNITGYKNMVTLSSLGDYFLDPIKDVKKLKYFNVDPVRPEKVKSIEFGYKSFLMNNKFNVDLSTYYSYYQDFIGYKIGFDPKFNNILTNEIIGGQVYRIATNATTTVTTMGASIGVNYFFKEKYTFGFNYSFNQLNKKDNSDPIIPAFNTPKNKFNVSIGGSQLEYMSIKNVSFNVNFKWIEGFVYEGSPQFTGDVPTYWMIDAMVSKELPKYHAQLKIGASNLTNNMALQVYGGPRIGRMAYVSLLFDISYAEMKNNFKK